VLRALIGTLIVTAVEASALALGLGGYDRLLQHPRALALLAAWFAGGLVLSLLRPVRGHDPQRTTREPPALLVALFAIPLVTPGLTAAGETLRWWPMPGDDPLRWAGVALSSAGLALRIVAMARLGSRFSPLLVVQREHALETSGPYAFVRHPGYLGAGLATLGAALAFDSAVGLAPALLFLWLLDRRARREEALLESHFGEAYRAYRARTGRLFPGVG
jgi:protein-S-isoprenylcysteine O-methyltransferase Ste14